MSRNELIAKIEALNEWEAMMEEAKTEADGIRSSIKAGGLLEPRSSRPDWAI